MSPSFRTNAGPLKRRVPETEAWDVVPDLTVEVISESNSANAVARKIEEYFQAGVSKVWVVYPSTNKIYVYDSPTRVRILQLGDELDGERLFPGSTSLCRRCSSPKKIPRSQAKRNDREVLRATSVLTSRGGPVPQFVSDHDCGV